MYVPCTVSTVFRRCADKSITSPAVSAAESATPVGQSSQTSSGNSSFIAAKCFLPRLSFVLESRRQLVQLDYDREAVADLVVFGLHLDDVEADVTTHVDEAFGLPTREMVRVVVLVVAGHRDLTRMPV